MPTERPIQPTDPEKEPKTKETVERADLEPKDAPLHESYGKDSGKHPHERGTPRQATEEAPRKR